MEWERDGYTISDDAARIDLETVCRLLAGSYWAAERSRAVIERSIGNSICCGLYLGAKQVGFARLVTDSATFAWLCDVLIDPDCRKAGLGKWLVECAISHPALVGCNLMLRTRDAHGLYERFGFTREECMLRWRMVIG
jgi:GNAT superfamily N-acetyltransferase